MKPTTILLPITHVLDTNLINYTKALAKEYDATLICLYITSPLSLTSCYSYPSLLYSVSSLNVDLIQMAHEDIAKKLDLLLADYPHETICLIGPTTNTIIHVANQKDVDLIVIPGPKDGLGNRFVVSPKEKLEKKCKASIIEYLS